MHKNDIFNWTKRYNGNTDDVDCELNRDCEVNCEVNLILTWSKDCVITNSTGEGKFAITETKLYVPIVTLSTKDNEKLL